MRGQHAHLAALPCIISFALLLPGCATSPSPSPFRPIENINEISGAYYNAPRQPGYTYGSLWWMLAPAREKLRDALEDQSEDIVRIDVDAEGVLAASLIRNGTIVATREHRFTVHRRGDRMRRHRHHVVARPLFPLLWGIGSETVWIGMDEQYPDRLVIAHTGEGVLLAVVLPIFGGGGAYTHHLFKPAEVP